MPQHVAVVHGVPSAPWDRVPADPAGCIPATGLWRQPFAKLGVTNRLVDWSLGAAMRMYRSSPLHPRLGAFFARALGRFTAGAGVVVKEVRGLRYELDLSEVIDASLYYSGSFEPAAERTLHNLAEPGMVVMDVGANVGYHALPLARRVGGSGLVLAVEPSERAMSRLRRNAELNHMDAIRLLRLALGDANVDSARLPIQSSYRLDGSAEPVVETVPIRRLDTIASEEGLERLDLIKIDVDGFEGRVLAGARQSLVRFQPAVFFELGPPLMRALGDDPEDPLLLLQACGYRLFTEGGRSVDGARALLDWIGPRVAANVLALPEGRTIPVRAPG